VGLHKLFLIFNPIINDGSSYNFQQQKITQTFFFLLKQGLTYFHYCFSIKYMKHTKKKYKNEIGV